MLQLIASNSLDELAERLGRNIQRQAVDVFLPHTIVTQTEGMNLWLKQQLASKQGIAANIEFKKPNDLILKVYQILGGSYINTLSRENLVWLLYHAMGQRDFKIRFPQQAQFFEVDGPDRDLKRMGLAEKVADLFDQYQIYRPQTIKKWNTLQEQDSGINWQAYLWVKVAKMSKNSLPDKTFVSEYILQCLQQSDKRSMLAEALPAISLFGLSIITEYHLQVLAQIAQVIDVSFYLLNPAPEIYWQDDTNERDLAVMRRWDEKDTFTIGNALLTGWGKVLQNTFRLLFRNDALINNYDAIVVPIHSKTLLGRIQSDIVNNHHYSDEAFVYKHPLEAGHIDAGALYEGARKDQDVLKLLNDESIVINCNYTPAREVETLYNYLVHLVQGKPHLRLSARDIVVMVHDIDAYAPYIKAVFDNAPYRFRYKIADVSLTQGDNLYSALEQILTLNENNFSAEAVMQLLDASFIRSRFNIDNIDALRDVVGAANIRFGLEGEQEDETNLVSWTYGIKRIMLGICMSGEELFVYQGDEIYPLDKVEGGASWEVIRFCHFVTVLMDSIKNRRSARRISEWVRYVEQTIVDLVYTPDDEPSEEYSYLLERLTRYNELVEVMEEEVSYEIFAHNFLSLLTAERRNNLFVSDGITFCSLIPMRSIPFKVVALLGMDYDKFPRREKTLSFNLITQKHQLGDRNIKDNDKHLFLETLLSAKEHLYISYLGKSATDNAVKPPSILVEELLSYIQSNIAPHEDVTRILVTEQPLHGFSHRYNRNDGKLYSFMRDMPSVHQVLNETIIDVQQEAVDELRWEDIIAFYKDALKFYYNKVLGVYYHQDQQLLAETEIFELDGLQTWRVQNELLQIRDAAALSSLRHRYVRYGLLPLKNVGQASIEQLYEDIHPVLEIVRKETDGLPACTLPFTLQLNDTLISGALPNMYNGKYLQVSWTSNIVRSMIETYLNILVGIASGQLFNAALVDAKKEKVLYAAALKGLDAAEARHRLESIIAFYKEGQRKKVPFCPELYREVKNLELLNDEALSMLVQSKIENSFTPIDNPYLMKEYDLGLFRQQGIATSFLQALALVINPLAIIFPQFDR
jgi:exodeoxyribonuclease V gamma subunit